VQRPPFQLGLSSREQRCLCQANSGVPIRPRGVANVPKNQRGGGDPAPLGQSRFAVPQERKTTRLPKVIKRCRVYAVPPRTSWPLPFQSDKSAHSPDIRWPTVIGYTGSGIVDGAFKQQVGASQGRVRLATMLRLIDLGSTIATDDNCRDGRRRKANLRRAGLHFNLQRRARSGRQAALRQLGSDYN